MDPPSSSSEYFLFLVASLSLRYIQRSDLRPIWPKWPQEMPSEAEHGIKTGVSGSVLPSPLVSGCSRGHVRLQPVWVKMTNLVF